MKISTASIFLSLLLGATSPLPGAEPFALKANDRVVFYGDSITYQRMYTLLTELYVVTRYPQLKVDFTHSGWGGDRVSGGSGGPIDLRLTRDVEAYHPDVVTIMLGMNDGNYTNHKDADDTNYFNGYRHMVESLLRALPGARLTLIGPSPFDDVTRPFTLQPGGYNAVLVHYSDFLRSYAQQCHSGFADLNRPVVKMLQRASATDSALAQKVIPDRVHPGWAGHLIMSEELLRAWHARSLVSAVSLNAGSLTVDSAQFTKVSGLSGGNNIQWTQSDEALPLPFANMIAADNEKTIALAIQSSDVTEALNQQPLQVKGLSPGRYSLLIDHEAIGAYSDAELSQGVNLAVLNTPMSRQAMTVRDLTAKRLDVHQQRWRTLQVPLTPLDPPHLAEAERALDALYRDLTDQQWAAAQPAPHQFELVLLSQ